MARQRFETKPTAFELFVLTHNGDHLFENKNIWQKNSDKKRNDPTLLNE